MSNHANALRVQPFLNQPSHDDDDDDGDEVDGGDDGGGGDGGDDDAAADDDDDDDILLELRPISACLAFDLGFASPEFPKQS